MNEIVFIADNYQKTQSFAKDFAAKLNPGDILAFYGNLGSGKTTFIQGLAKGFGIEKRIISPTFIIVRTYDLNLKSQTPNPKSQDLKSNIQEQRTKNKEQRMGTFYHIDLYRTQGKNDLLSVGIDQIINEKNAFVAIEWVEKMGDLLPKKRIELHFKYIDEDKREIRIKYINDK
jgi:tRNA threonylcarbamoyladenosine biosynthesis protein TsaE